MKENDENIKKTQDEDVVKEEAQTYKVKNSKGTYYVYDISVSDPIGDEVTTFIVGIDSQGKIAKVVFTSYGDTYAEKYDEKYVNKIVGKGKVYNSDKVAGATVTGNVIKDAINAAIAHFGGVNNEK